jgi:tetracycline repressor-like protein
VGLWSTTGAADQVDLVQPTCVQPSQQYRSGAIKRSGVSQEFNASRIASSSITCQNWPDFAVSWVSEYSLTVLASGRDRLLSAALRLFAAKGYAATSVADIQRESGLAPGSGALYKHFGSKRELLEAAVAHRIDSIVAAR